MKHVMVDIETMGTSPNAPVLSVGAVIFDANGLGEEFYSECSLKSAFNRGSKPDPDTIAFWMNQEDAPRKKLANAKGKNVDMLNAFCEFFPEDATFWGNGAAFDNVLLREALRREGLHAPWKFWNDRCYRTVKNMFNDVKIKRVGTHHNALDDAKSQALHLIEISKLHGDFL